MHLNLQKFLLNVKYNILFSYKNIMSQSLSQTLSTPLSNQETKPTLISSISNDMNQGYGALKNTIIWWGNKKEHIGTKSNEILTWSQITSQGEKRQQARIQRRKPL